MESQRGRARTPAGISRALRHHLVWQQRLLRRDPHSARFLVLRPGDKFTVCSARFETDVRSQCKALRPPKGAKPAAGEHWDAFVLRTRPNAMRPVPGLGNVMLSIVSAAVMAIASERVLLVENYTVAAHSLGPPLSDFLLETSPWRPHVEQVQTSGGAVDWFVSHDDYSAASYLCSSDLRLQPPHRLLRVFSNQYFLPTLMLNPHHAHQVERLAEPPLFAPGRFPSASACAARATAATAAGTATPTVSTATTTAATADTATAAAAAAATAAATNADADANAGADAVDADAAGAAHAGGCAAFSGGLWGPAVRFLLRPKPELQAKVDAFAEKHLAGRVTIGTHIRSALTGHHADEVAKCAAERLATANASVLLVATMHASAKEFLAGRLDQATVIWNGDTPDKQGASAAHLDSTVFDMLILSRTSSLLLSKSSTFGYVAHGLSAGPAAVIGASTVSWDTGGSSGAVSKCATLPTGEAFFHYIGASLRSSFQCRRARANASKHSVLFQLSNIVH